MSTFNEQATASIELLDRRSGVGSIIPAQHLSPMEELQAKIVRVGDLDMLKQLYEIQKQWRKDEAERLFVEAMASFKSETIRIRKDKENRQYNSRYTSLGNLVDTVTPYLSKYQLSASWDIEQADKIKVTCIITHSAGHSKSVSMAAPPDGSGQKNPIQQIKSTITYLKICTFESACGLASVEGNLDDDANSSGQQGGRLDQSQAEDYLALIEGSGSLDELKGNYRKAQDAAEAAKDHNAAREFGECKNAIYRKLAAKGAK